MKILSLVSVVALLVATVPAPAQASVDGRYARHVRVSSHASRPARHDSHHEGREAVRCLPVPRPVAATGRWETVCEQVFVPGGFRDEHVPPTYGWVFDRCGHRHWGVVDPGGCRRVWVPPHHEHRTRRVWVRC